MISGVIPVSDPSMQTEIIQGVEFKVYSGIYGKDPGSKPKCKSPKTSNSFVGPFDYVDSE